MTFESLIGVGQVKVCKKGVESGRTFHAEGKARTEALEGANLAAEKHKASHSGSRARGPRDSGLGTR